MLRYLIIRNIFRGRLNNKCYFCTKSENEFTAIYKFPYIRSASLINRLKLYQSALTVASIPGSIALCNFGLISVDSVITTIVLGFTGTITLFLFGIVPNNLIGFVYLNNNDTVRIAHLDSWGNRKNIELPLKDIVPLTDLPAIATDPLYLTMRRFSTPETLKIHMKYGEVLDKDRFHHVFLQNV